MSVNHSGGRFSWLILSVYTEVKGYWDELIFKRITRVRTLLVRNWYTCNNLCTCKANCGNHATVTGGNTPSNDYPLAILSDHHFSQAILSMSKTRTQLNVYQNRMFFNTFDLDYYVKILFHFHIYFCLLYAYERICWICFPSVEIKTANPQLYFRQNLPWNNHS